MASASNSVYLYSNNKPSSFPFTFSVSFNETSTNVANNTSSISVSASLQANGSYWATSYVSTIDIYWYDNRAGSESHKHSYQFAGLDSEWDGRSTSTSFTVTHKDDGSLSGYVKAVFTKGNTTTGWACNSGSVSTGLTALSQIPRKANLTSAPDFTDEDNPTINYTNSAGNSVTSLQACISLTGSVDDIPYRDIPKTGSSYTFNLTNEERTTLRQNTPTNQRTVTFYVKTVIGGITYHSIITKNFTIINANPTFSNFNFADVNTKTTALTRSNQDMILGYSNLKITIPSSMKAVAVKSASMSKYRFNNQDFEYKSSGDATTTVNGIDTGTFIVYAIDSRGNSTSVTKNARNIYTYNSLTKKSITVARSNGISEETTLILSGTIDRVNFGRVTNSIKVAKYRYKTTTSSTWSSYKNITLTVDSQGNFSFNDLITGDEGNVGFNISNSYNIEVYVSDELSEVTFTANLNSGTPNISLSKNGVGIMCKYDDELGGLLQVGGQRLDGLGDPVPINSIFDYDGDTVPDGYVEVFDPNEYSTDEIVIGKWIDGKPIYRKVILSSVALATGYNYINHNISNFKFCINARIIELGEANYIYPYLTSGGNGWDLITAVSNTQVTVRCYNDSMGARSRAIILEYVKTVD